MKRTQPSISRQIRELESELKATLFVRDPHRVELTAEGRKLLSKIEGPMHSLVDALDTSLTPRDEIAGILRIGVYAEIGQAVLFKFVLEFCKKYPQIIPDVRYLQDSDIRELLRRGDLDFGVLSHAFDNETLRSHRLMKERLTLIGRPHLKLPDMKSSKLPIIAYHQDDPSIELFEKRSSGKRPLPSRIVCHVNSHRSMIEALLSMEAFAFMPVLSAKKELDSGLLKEFAGHSVEQMLYLVYAAQAYESVARKKFKEHLLQCCSNFEK